jgi:hypothetical protein
MLMGAHDGAVDEHLFEVGILGQAGEDPMPDACARPPRKALIDTIPRTEFGGQVAPRRPYTRDPQHRFNKQPIVARRAARIAQLARQQRLDPLKLIITQPHTRHPDSAQKSGYDHKTDRVNSPSIRH